MTARLYRCKLCGYHYGPAKMVRYIKHPRHRPGEDFYVCRDRDRCDFHIRQREADRKAVGK